DLAARQRTLRSDLKAATDALIVMAKALEEHDRASTAHGEQTAERAVALARALHLDEDAQSRIRMGAQLRDVGYARLPAELVAHRGQLSKEEREVIERHPLLGEELLRGYTPLATVLPIVRMHHEHLDGSGYPTRVRGEEIPLEVRIVTVADRFEALLVDRPDRAAMSEPEAIHVLQEEVVRGHLDAWKASRCSMWCTLSRPRSTARSRASPKWCWPTTTCRTGPAPRSRALCAASSPIPRSSSSPPTRAQKRCPMWRARARSGTS